MARVLFAGWRAARALCLSAIVGAVAAAPFDAAAVERPLRGEEVEAALEDAVPIARIGFDVYLDDGATLIYVRKACAVADLTPSFFLRIRPVDTDNLAESERPHGVENADFRFWTADFSSYDDGRCVVAQRLPGYRVDMIDTGQFDDKGRLWWVEMKFSRMGIPPTARVVPVADRRTPTVGERTVVRSHLYAFDIQSVPLSKPATRGGAIEPLGNELLVATPWGRLALVRPNGAVEWLHGEIPMNLTGYLQSDIDNPDPEDEGWVIDSWPFRVADILAKRIHPDRWELFATHHYFFGDCIGFRLSSTTIEQKTGEWADQLLVSPSWRTVFDAEPCLPYPHIGHQGGGKMLMDGADSILIAIGDHGRDGTWAGKASTHMPSLPQDPASHLGKLVSVDLSSGRAKVLALGLRNPQGLARDREGRLWAAEHGPQGGDELNILEEGRNYGWPYATYGLSYSSTLYPTIDARNAGSHQDFALPAYSWVPSVGISSVTINDETRLPLWKDDLLVGSLAGQSLFRVRRAGNRVVYAERIKIEGGRIRDIATMPDGRIALLRDGFSVAFASLSRQQCRENPDTAYPPEHIYMLQCSEPPAGSREHGSPIANASVPLVRTDDGARNRAFVADGATLFARHCGQCHRARNRRHDVGPHLVGVVGRRAGAAAGYNFSAAFAALDHVWTDERLVQFLTATDEFAPGSQMPNTGVSEEQARIIVEYLNGGE